MTVSYELQLFDAADPARLIGTRLFGEGSVTIGRDPRANWAIDDPACAISRWHCMLFARPEGLTICVTGANGMFFDESGERLPESAEILLPLPCSLMLGGFRLVANAAVQEAKAPGPSDWEDAAIAREAASGSLLEAFCQGAELDSSLLSGEEPEEIMRRAGAIYREMVIGIGDLMVERNRARGEYEMQRTTIGGKDNNPFKWASPQRLALDLLLSGPSSFLPGPDAVRSSFRDIKGHLVASFAGLKGSLQAAIRAFSPDEIDRAIPDKGSFLKNRAIAQLDEVRRRHLDLLAQLEGQQGSLDRAFVRAYDAAEVEARQARR